MNRRARRCLGVDIGSTSLKIAELSQDKSGVIIQRLVEAPLDVAPDTPAETRWAAVIQTLRDVLREHKFGTRQAVFALPGHAVFVRRVRLPRTSEERLERIIRFEARQQIPFPLEQTILQYQIAPTEVEDEVEVLLVAIKRDIVENYMNLIRKLPLRPVRLGVSSFALYNFNLFDQGLEPESFDLDAPAKPKGGAAAEESAEAAEGGKKPEKPAKAAGLGGMFKGLLGGKKKKAKEPKAPSAEEAPTAPGMPVAGPEEVRAYINIGAATMDLAIGRTGGSKIIGFARSIPVAGNQLTRNIQERCKLDTFAEAERVKREKTQVVLSGLPIPVDRCNETACRAIMPIVDRMVAEIRRSLDFYISQPDGMAVDRLVLSGGQAGLPNLAAYIEDRVGIQVEIGREIHNPQCRFNERAEVAVTPFATSIGLALHGLDAGCISIDFLPEQLKGWIEFKRKNFYLTVQAALLAGMLFLVSQTGDRVTSQWATQARDMEMVYQQQQPLLERLKKAVERRGLAGYMVFLLIRSHAVSPAFGEDRDYFFRVLSLIQSERPPDVFFQSVYMGPNGDILISGYAEQERSAADLAQRLNALKNQIENASLRGSPQQVPNPSATGPGAARIYGFLITAKIKGRVSRIEPTPTPAIRPGWGPAKGPVGPAGLPPGADMES